MQGGTASAPATWATLQAWLHKQSKYGVLIVFENSEEMLQDASATWEVRHACDRELLASCPSILYFVYYDTAPPKTTGAVPVGVPRCCA